MEVRRFDVDAAGGLGTPETLFEGEFGRLRGAVSGADMVRWRNPKSVLAGT